MSSLGMIFNIQRFCLHDGPGIRTVLFLKGCPLRCLWCSNPESWKPDSELMYNQKLCLGCGRCLEVCPRSALVLPDGRTGSEKRAVLDRSRCTACGLCAEVCPSGALRLAGRLMPIEDVMPVLLADRNYYETSGGGVTFSGGEPVGQAPFVIDLASALAREGVGCALETSGCCQPELFKQVVSHMDRVLFDIKLVDSAGHLRNTGVGNEQILENLLLTASMKPTVVRIPLIPSVNMDPGAWEALFGILSGCPIEAVHLLPYHAWGSGKHVQLGGCPWVVPTADAAANESIQRLFARNLAVPVLLC